MLSNRDAVVPSMKVFAILLVAIRDKIFFCARKPMSRALKTLSVMTEIKLWFLESGRFKALSGNWNNNFDTNDANNNNSLVYFVSLFSDHDIHEINP